ncbi:MAG: hypothetical protein H8D80_01815 [Proteobacteria bacterium]|nr:hypothetical protein [Pseudomonadota bacterium]
MILDIENWNDWVKVGVSLGAILVGMSTFFLTKWRKKVKKKKNIISLLDFPIGFWDVHTKIQETLTELRLMVDCARTQLIQFHNSGHFLDGISMKKFSLTHESVQRSIIPCAEKTQDLIMSMFLSLLSLVKENDTKNHMVSELEDSYEKNFLESNNIISFSVLPVRSGGIISGYVMAQWCCLSKTDDIDAEIVDDWMSRSRNLLEVELQEQKNKIQL